MRLPFLRSPLVAGVLVVAGALAGCDEEMITLDSGTPSSLDVQVYVDVDGDGSFTSGVDQGVADATVTASNPEGASATATTDGSGSASFAALTPGSYTLSVSASPPAGAVLATAASPVVEAPFQGDELTAEFRYAFQPGSIAGQVFRDDNESGSFEPDADLPAAGITMELLDVSETVLRTTTTGTDGSYAFEVLRPGSYFVRITPLETMDIEGATLRNVTVSALEEARVPFTFEGTLVIDVADARTAPEGQTVTVEAVVTWQPDFDTRAYWLQDETGGINVFDFDRPDLSRGDLVRVTGTRGAFDGETQISPVISVEVLGQAALPEPALVSAAEIATQEFRGQLVTAEGVVQTVDVRDFGNQRITLQDAEGGIFAVWADSRTGVEEDTWVVGGTYAVTGVLGTDDDEDPEAQIEVRDPDDVQAGGSTLPIAEVRALALDEPAVIQGIVTWQEPFNEGRVYFLQDGSAGISVFHFGAPDLPRGSLVRLRGVRGEFEGEAQLTDISDIQVLGTVAVPNPRGVTGAEINAGDFQGQLATVTGEIVSVDVANQFGSTIATVEDGAGTEFLVWADNRTDVFEETWPAVGTTVRLTGVLGIADETPSFRLEVRDPDDIVEATPGQISIAEARGLPEETVVTVEGVVTWQTPWDERVIFFQDATAGISTFDFSIPDDLEAGERIRVTGEVGAFRGETQLGSFSDLQRLGVEAEPAPRAVTGAQINDGLFQGELVQAVGTVLEVEVVNEFGTQVVTIRDASGTPFTVFADNRTGVAEGDWTVGATVQVIGVLGTDDRNTPAPRLEIRSPDDLSAPSP